MNQLSTSGEKGTHDRQERHGNVMVMATIGGVVLTTLINVKWLSPLVHAGAVFPFYFAALRQRTYTWALLLAARWTVALFTTVLVVGVFVPSRLQHSLPMADQAVEGLQSWVIAGAPPVVDYSYLFWGTALFLTGSIVSGGFVAFVVASIGLGSIAYGALFLERHGVNIIQVALVAVPPWGLALIAAAVFLIVPSSTLLFDRFFREHSATTEGNPPPPRPTVLRTYMYIGAALFLTGIGFRLTTADMWRSLLERWTVL